MTRGTMYRYADYGYGSYLTYQYTVKFGNVSATAYCVQPSKPGPGSGTYTINKVGDGKALAKVCYYGTKASGDDGFFTEENGYGNLSAGARFILVHLAASYANGSVNEKTGDIASQVGQTPQGWSGSIFSLIQNLSDSVIVPIAGMIITFVLCYELISMLTEKNNMHDIDTWMFFKYAIQLDFEEKTTNLDSVRRKKIKQLEAESNVLKSERIRQYESYAEGIITKEKYMLKKMQITDRMNSIQTEIETLTRLSAEEETYKNKVASAVELLEGEMQHEKITKELVNATIDTVYVYDKKRIEVVFSFDDILMKAIEKYQKGIKEA